MLFYAHSGLRYLVLLAGLATLVYALAGIIVRAPYKRPMRILSTIFAGTLHLQVVMGLALLFTGRFYPQLIGHIFLMVLAAVAAQVVPSIMRRRPEEQRSYLPHAVSAIVALGLIYFGVVAIGRGLFETSGMG
jgi:4-amino-4-deoxy-L-arabinose transferase-like glycosyltransferase